MDALQPQLKARLAPPDPVPVYDPRPENFIASRFDPTPVSGNPISTEWQQPPLPWRPPPPPSLSPFQTEQAPGGPITIE